MPANILDPRMIDPTKPLSCIEINTNFLSADTVQVNDLLIEGTFTTDFIAASSIDTGALSVSAGDISILTSNNATINTLVTNFTATTLAVSSYTFTDADNSKVFHIDTTTQPEVTAIFNVVSDGFNIGIINAGTGVIYLSSNFTPTILAPNAFNSVQYSGMFIYKINNQLFGVGVFE